MKLLIVAIIAALLLTACGDESTPEPTRTPLPTFTATAEIPTVAPQNLVAPTPVLIILIPTNTPAPVEVLAPTETATVAPPIVEPTIAPPTDVPPPLPTDTPIPVQPVQVIEQPTAVPVVAPAAVCDCSGNNLNCGDFGTHSEAQSCYDYCRATVGADIHDIDGNDADGLACESLP